MMESGVQIKKGDADTKAMNVGSVDADLLDAVVRLVRLADPSESRQFPTLSLHAVRTREAE